MATNEQGEKETCAERPHSEFGPSGLKSLKQCRGFKNHGNKSAASEKGDRIHWALENDDPSELLDEDEHDIYLQCRADMAEAREMVENLAGRPLDKNQELRLQIDLGCVKTFGTADVVDIAGEYCLLGDYKSGVSHIDSPPENLQSMAYAIGVFQMFPSVNKIYGFFSVPARHETPSGWYVREHLTEYIETVGRLIMEAAYVRRIWAQNGDIPLELLTPGDQCRYCIHGMENRCPALGALVFDVVKRYDAGGALPPEGSIHGSDIDDPETLSRMLPLADIAEKWANGVKYRAKEVAMRDGRFPGYIIKSMGSPREISDPVALKEFAEGCGLEIDELLKAATFSLSGLTKIVSAKAPRGQKQDAVRQFEEGLELFGALTRKPERFSLKPLSGDLDDED